MRTTPERFVMIAFIARTPESRKIKVFATNSSVDQTVWIVCGFVSSGGA